MSLPSSEPPGTSGSTSELRLDPLTGRWVAIATERANRPRAFAPQSLTVEQDLGRPCPFCPGNEESTPPTLESWGPDGWRVRVIPNLYPAFSGSGPLVVEQDGPVFTHAEATGIHEVFVFDRNHAGSWGSLSDEQAALTMQALAERMIAHEQSGTLRYSQPIVNYGREAGASLAHPHGQLLGLSFVPAEVATEQSGFERFRGGCLLCATVRAERAAEQRIVFSNDDVTVLCPYWAANPFELLVIPTEHHAHMHRAQESSRAAAGQAVRDGLQLLNAHLGPLPYNLVFHSSPFRVIRDFHWHIHVVPKLITKAGFEMGTGVMINVVPPEQAAGALIRVLAASS